jgi:hypothetical protein
MKYETVWCEGHYVNEPRYTYEVLIAKDEWDEAYDAEDERIFYYMDGEPLVVGADLDGFVITKILEE